MSKKQTVAAARAAQLVKGRTECETAAEGRASELAEGQAERDALQRRAN